MRRIVEPSYFVWANAGPHVDEILADGTRDGIVTRKGADIERFGWCLWAYGGSGPAHPEKQVRRLAKEFADGGPVTLAMPVRDDAEDPGGVPFTRFRRERHSGSAPEPLPSGMTQVTGPPRAWAFVLDHLEWAPSTTFIDVAAYEAPYWGRGRGPLSEYLEGSHGRACAVRLPGDDGHAPVLKEVGLIGRLVEPYAVYLSN